MKFEDVYRVVRLIPQGMVMSYSGVARQCGSPRSARYVGFALHALPANTRVPWWRVINARGRISNQYAPVEQKRRLEAEGVVVGEDLCVDMRLFDAEEIVYRKLKSSQTRMGASSACAHADPMHRKTSAR
jgi:methylated-DNA-protein-cysteine methyltransferase-like protein